MLSYFKIPRSHSLVFMLQLFALLRRMAEPIPFLPPSLYSSRNLVILENVNCNHSLMESKGSSDHRGKEVFHWVISSDLLPLNDLDIPTLPHRFSGSRYSPDIFFVPSSLALSCSWEVLQDLGSNHLSILLTIHFFCYSAPTNVPLPSIFRELVGMTFYFDSHCPSAEEYWSLSLSFVAALFTSLTLNAAKSSILYDRIKRHPKVWWSAEVEDAISERCTTRSSNLIGALV